MLSVELYQSVKLTDQNLFATELTEEHGKIVIKSDKAKTKIKTLIGKCYPPIPTVDEFLQ